MSSKITNDLPNKYDLANVLEDSLDEVEPGEELEVRLQVVPGEGWTLHTGDPACDIDHRGHWGSGTLTHDGDDTDCAALAEDLIDQVRDAAAYAAE